jgi:CheY-like chemotaxis protein
MNKKRLLFAEDLEMLREPLAIALEEQGYIVYAAQDGEEAYRLVLEATEPFDLFLLDVGMPKMNGGEFLSAVRKLPSCADIPAIMLSGSKDDQLLSSLGNLKISAYLIKGQFSFEELFNCLGELVHQK